MKKSIVFYCHNFWWLGHTKRILLIIKEIVENFSDIYNVVFLNSWEKQDFLFKWMKWVKVMNLPNYEIKNYKIIDWKNVANYRKVVFNKLFSIWSIEKLVIEHYPFGRNFLDDEIRFLIWIFKKYNDRWKVFSSVRDIFDLEALNERNLELFDRFLVHSDRKVINYDWVFFKEIENKFIYTGFVVDKGDNPSLNPFPYIKEGSYTEVDFLVSLWGGQDGMEYVLDFLENVKRMWEKCKIYVSLWKNYTEDNLEKINDFWIEDIVVKDYFEDFLELKKKAKLVVSMWGYNNFVENAFYDKNCLIYPRGSDNEQKKRLEVFGEFFYNLTPTPSPTGGKPHPSPLLRGEGTVGIDSIKAPPQSPRVEGEGKERAGGASWRGLSNRKKANFDWAYFSASFICNYWEYKYIKIRPTNACNARCEMCWVIKRKLKSNDLEKLENVILDFYKLWWEVINFTWWEPTIYGWFWELLKLSKSLWLITSVSTNGSSLWDEFFDNLYDGWVRLIDYIDISVDGLWKMQDKRRNCKWLFETIDNNLHRLLDTGIFVHINVTVRMDNISEVREIFDYFKDKGVNSISFWMVTSSPFNDTSDLIPEKEQIEKFYLEDRDYILNNCGGIEVKFSPDVDFHPLSSEWPHPSPLLRGEGTVGIESIKAPPQSPSTEGEESGVYLVNNPSLTLPLDKGRGYDKIRSCSPPLLEERRFRGEVIKNLIQNIQNKNSFSKEKWVRCEFIYSKKELRINEWWDVSPCCEIDDFDEGLWNINEKDLLSIVFSREYEEFLGRKFPNISKACLNCKIWE